jgi:hypothetical protein
VGERGIGESFTGPQGSWEDPADEREGLQEDWGGDTVREESYEGGEESWGGSIDGGEEGLREEGLAESQGFYGRE